MTDSSEHDGDRNDDAAQRAGDDSSGRDKSTESTPTPSGHSTSDDQASRNREDESPG